MLIADYVVSTIAARGVRHVFGYPGAAILPLMEAIDRHPDVEWVLMRHEGSAALAASACARLTGRLAVCLVSSGPGATNLVTGLVDAQVDRVPVLALTGLVPTWKQGRAGFQDLDQARLLGTVLGQSTSCTHPDQVPGLLRDLIGHAEQCREATHLAIPHDIQSTVVVDGDRAFAITEPPEPLVLQSPPEGALELVARELAGLREALIVVGPRALHAGPAIEHLAEHLGAPIVSALDAKGVIDESHRCSLGVLGIFGSPGVELTREILLSTPAVLAFGLDDVAGFLTDQSGVQVRDLYQFEPDFSSVTHRFHRTRTLAGPLDRIAEGLTSRIGERTDLSFLERALALKRRFLQPMAGAALGAAWVHPVAVLEGLSALLRDDDVLALDIGDSTVWAAQFLRLRGRQRVLVSNQLGVMGFCLPALIAAQLARPGSRALGICGDGAFQMVMGELMTAVQQRLPLVLLVFENGVLQRVAAQQVKPVGTHLVNPDLVALARACGAEAALLDGSSDVATVLRRALATTDRPFLVDCRIGPGVRAPMSSWDDGFVPMQFS